MALLLFSGCGDDETTGIATAQSQMKPLVEAACDWMFGCCSPDELVYEVGAFTVDADDCTERMLDAVSAGAPLELEQMGLSDDPAQSLLILALSINEGRVDVDGSAVRACAEATTDRACNVFAETGGPVSRCVPTAVEEDNPCDPEEMFRGKQGAGEECDGPWECQEGLRCVDFGIAGVCAARSSDGDNCFSDAECAQGLVCDYAEGVCKPGAQAGEACEYANPLDPIPGTETIRCADGLACDPTALKCTGGFCSPGSPCDDVFTDSDCPETYFCIGNSVTEPSCRLQGEMMAPCNKNEDCVSNFCDPFEEVCGALAADGEACSGSDECDSGFCDMSACQPQAAAGEACPSNNNDQCAGGYCDLAAPTPTCTAYVNEGGPCPTGVECNPTDGTLQCIDAMCLRAPFPNGTTCFDNIQCQSQACFMGECSAGAVIGQPCRTDGTAVPCIVGTFCETAEGAVDGLCAELRRPGQGCENASQCWGECIIRFGTRMCDQTTAVSLAETWCDGP